MHARRLARVTVGAERVGERGEVLGCAGQDGGRLDVGDLERRDGPLALGSQPAAR
jgi:hypothetical protein